MSDIGGSKGDTKRTGCASCDAHRRTGATDNPDVLPIRELDPIWGSAAFRPGDPCPNLLTESQAIRYLRLDSIDIKNPEETLRRYRKSGHLKATQVSKKCSAHGARSVPSLLTIASERGRLEGDASRRT